MRAMKSCNCCSPGNLNGRLSGCQVVRCRCLPCQTWRDGSSSAAGGGSEKSKLLRAITIWEVGRGEKLEQ